MLQNVSILSFMRPMLCYTILFHLILILNLCFLADGNVSEVSPDYVKKLEENYVVQKGKYTIHDATKKCAEDEEAQCFGSNPITPYGVILLPMHHREKPWDRFCPPSSACVTEEDGTQYAGKWRVERGETILMITETPPESLYFSYTPDLFSMWHYLGWLPAVPRTKMDLVTPCPPGPSRCELHASINNSVNIKNIQLRDGQSKFGQKVAILLSWDEHSRDEVTNILTSSEDFKANVNHLQYPGMIFQMGVDSTRAAEFSFTQRTARIFNDTESDEYYDTVSAKTEVYRISVKSESERPSRLIQFPSFEHSLQKEEEGFKEKGTDDDGVTHEDLLRGLENLHASVTRTYAHMDLTETRMESVVKSSVYEDFINRGYRGVGIHMDSGWGYAEFIGWEILCRIPFFFQCGQSQSARMSADGKDFFLVAGVNHAATNKATYTSVYLYNALNLGAVAYAPSWDLEGTADAYLDEDDPTAKYLYVIKFARFCDDGDVTCRVVPLGQESATEGLATLAETDYSSVFERIYMNPNTGVAPAREELIQNYVMHFAEGTSSIPEISYFIYDAIVGLFIVPFFRFGSVARNFLWI